MPRGHAFDAGGRQVPMRVIVHGVHRTGSLSMRTALHQLGFHHCYHMATVFENVETDGNRWIEAIEAKFAGKGKPFTREDWDHLLGQSQACVDMPSALFTNELAQAYPEAKVIILNRDPEKWYESVKESIYKLLKQPSLLAWFKNKYCILLDSERRTWARLTATLGKYGTPYDHGNEKDKAIAWFNKVYNDVRGSIPKERCFEFTVKDGYEPLCAFLGVPVPMIKDKETGEVTVAPFPHVNDRAFFASRHSQALDQRLKVVNDGLVTIFCKTITLGVLGYYAYFLWKKCLSGQH